MILRSLGRDNGALAIATDAPSIQEAVEAVRDHYGLDHVTYHHQPIGSIGPAAPYVKSTYPDEWLSQYLRNGYIHVDPVVLAGFSRMLPFDWSDVKWTEDANEFMTDALEHGLGGNGYSVPLIDKRVRRALFSINSRMPQSQWSEFTREHASTLAEIGTILHRRLVSERYPNDDALPRLNPREIECLSWTAQGLTAKEIARQINVTENTAATYIKSARLKLNCGTLAQAVAKAIQIGLVTP